MAPPVLLTTNYYTYEQREKAFRFLRQIARVVQVQAYEFAQENLRGYMLAVEGVVLTEDTIKALDAIKAHHVFTYMPHEFPWRKDALDIHSINTDGFREDGTEPIFEDYQVPQVPQERPTRDPIMQAIKNVIGV